MEGAYDDLIDCFVHAEKGEVAQLEVLDNGVQ